MDKTSINNGGIADDKSLVILGAGPAGLTAGYDAAQKGWHPVILEKANMVGGISRTETYKDYYFDVGGHRFFSKIAKVNVLWQEMMGDQFLKVNRQSRIFYNEKFFNYPLRAFKTITNLGIMESMLIITSYIHSKVRPCPDEKSFENWIINRFGQRLYETFFKTYTEKVWGIPCHQIKSDWAAQRIKSLSLTVAVYNALLGGSKAKSLIDEFYYPLKGPGMMWQRFQQASESMGAKVMLNSRATRINLDSGRVISVTFVEENNTLDLPVNRVISSIPVTSLIKMIFPAPPKSVLDAVENLTYRAFVIVVLMIDKADLFTDQWIYIHSPKVKVGRIQNFKNWSMAMIPDADKTSIGMEYFCDEGDEIWSMPDDRLIGLARQEISVLKLADEADVFDGVVLRQPKAYPVYDQNFNAHLKIIREFLDSIENLTTIGRNGLHRYNNMDHSMITGLMAVENLSGANHDLWALNDEEEYLEEEQVNKEAFPVQLADMLKITFARMDKLGFATAIGFSSGLISFLATLWLTIKSPDNLSDFIFLYQYINGHTFTVQGAFLTFAYTFFWGFLFGWMFAYIRNLFIALYIFYLRRKAEVLSFRDFMTLFR